MPKKIQTPPKSQTVAKTDQTTGLTSAEAAFRLAKFGPNLIAEKKRRPLIIAFLEQFKDLMVIILIIAAIFAIISGEFRDASVIIFIVFLNAIIGFVQEYKAEKAIEALRKMIAPKAKVLRDGHQMEIDATQVVPGDILILNEGDSIAADAELFEANELEAQESALTGESTPVQKLTYDLPETSGTPSDQENMVFLGTNITHGSGRAIVKMTGMETQMGQIAKLTIETKKDLSPLQRDLNNIGILVGKVSFVISAIILAAGTLIQHKQFTETLLFATSVAVAAVPEGLPATITIALAMGIRRLASKNAIIKQLSSVETLGATTVICSDKTGTLTKNEMTVEETFYDSAVAKKMLIAISGLCNNAALSHSSAKKDLQIIGDPTEGALLIMNLKEGLNQEKLLKDFEKIHEIPFDSNRKRMTEIVREKNTGTYFAFTKGAPDNIVQICTQNIYKNQTVKMDEKSRENLLNKNEEMANRALRVLAFSYREIGPKEWAEIHSGTPNTTGLKSHHTGKQNPDAKNPGKPNFNKIEIEKNQIFVGMVGMIDPPRPEVKAAVDLTRKAGIRTYIITGDHGLTARAIAKNLGLITDQREHLILTGQDLNRTTEHELKEHLKNKNLDIIFARVSPEHKLLIVTLLKELGEIVAVTGDGVNDAPALKRADIGVAMGISGTDVSKEAANMVLADDSYSTIVTAIKEGRTIYENMKKFIFYVFSCNIGELITVLGAIVLNLPAPLTAVLILCVDLGTDVLPATALAIDPSEPGIMERPPHNPKVKIMNKNFIIRYAYLGLLMGLIVMVVYILTLYRYGWYWGEVLDTSNLTYLKASSSAFVLLVVIQMVNVFNSRSEKYSAFKIGFFSNLYLLGAIAISLAVTFLIVENDFLQSYLHTTSLNFLDWIIIVGSSLLVLLAEEIRKLISRKYYSNTNGPKNRSTTPTANPTTAA